MSNSGGQSAAVASTGLGHSMINQVIQHQQQMAQQQMQPPQGSVLTSQLPVASQQQVASTGFFQVTI